MMVMMAYRKVVERKMPGTQLLKVRGNHCTISMTEKKIKLCKTEKNKNECLDDDFSDLNFLFYFHISL